MYQLAQINVARMIGVNIDDPIMRGFVENIDQVNALAEKSEGFVWRLTDEDIPEGGDPNPSQDAQILLNVSVWTDVASLEQFTFKTFHADFMRRRKEWFRKFGSVHLAMWWIQAGDYPSAEEAVVRLQHLQQHGPSERAFSFAQPFPPPS